MNLHNPMVKVLQVDGILDEILAEHVKAENALFRGDSWDDIIGEMDLGREARVYNLPEYMITVNRATFLKQIQEMSRKVGARYHTGKELASVEQNDGPDGFVKAMFRDGSTAE